MTTNQHSTMQKYLILGLNKLGIRFLDLWQILIGFSGLINHHYVFRSWSSCNFIGVSCDFPLTREFSAISNNYGIIFQFKDDRLLYLGKTCRLQEPNATEWTEVKVQNNTVEECVLELGLADTEIIGAVESYTQSNGKKAEIITTVYINESKLLDYILKGIYRVNPKELPTQIACVAMQDWL